MSGGSALRPARTRPLFNVKRPVKGVRLRFKLASLMALVESRFPRYATEGLLRWLDGHQCTRPPAARRGARGPAPVYCEQADGPGQPVHNPLNAWRAKTRPGEAPAGGGRPGRPCAGRRGGQDRGQGIVGAENRPKRPCLPQLVSPDGCQKLRVSRQFDEPARCSTCASMGPGFGSRGRDVTDLRIGRATAATGRATCRWRLPPLRPVFGTNNPVTPRSTPRSRPPARVNKAVALPSSPRKCESSPRNHKQQPPRSHH